MLQRREECKAKRKNGNGFGLTLGQYVAVFPTPSVTDPKGSSREGQRRGQLSEAVAIGGQLNPTWVEWLMGFPLGWTDLEDSETPSCPR